MVELFDTIMSTFTHISSLATSALSSHLRTNLRLVSTERSPTVFIIVVIKWAALQVMILWILLALLDLELEKVKEHGCLRHADVARVKAIAMGLVVAVWASNALIVICLWRARITRTIIINIQVWVMAHLIIMLIKLLGSYLLLLLASRRVKHRLS